MLTDKEKKSLRQPSHGRLFFYLRKVLLYVLTAVIFIYAAGFIVIAPLARWKIGQMTNSAVYVQSGRFSGLFEIRLKGLIIAADDKSFVTSPILQSDQLNIHFNPQTLLKGSFQITSVEMEDFLVSADYDQRWNFSALLSSGKTPGMVKLPYIELRSGAVRVRRKEGTDYEVITIGGLNGKVAAQTHTRQYHFSIESDGRFGFDGTKLEGCLEMPGPDEKSHLSAAGSICMPKARILENSWALKNISLECYFDKDAAEIKRLAFEMGQGKVELSGTFDRKLTQMNVQLDAQNIAIADQYAADTLVYSEPFLKYLDQGLLGFLRRFHPAGTGDAQLIFAGRLDDLSQSRLEGRIYSRDVRVLDEKFPYAIDRLEGEILFSGRQVRLNNLQAHHKGALFSLSGLVENSKPAKTIDFQMTSENLPLDEDLFKALNPQTKKIWFTFAPSGIMGLDYHYRQKADGLKDLTIGLQLQSVSAVYKYFPYPLENLKGSILITQDEITLNQLLSTTENGSTVRLDGRISELKNPFPRYDVNVQGKGIFIDQNLSNALPPEKRAYLDLIDIQAQADVDLKIVSGPSSEGKPEFTAGVKLTGDKLVLKEFPILMTGVQIEADVTDDRLDLHSFKASANGGQMAMSGRFFKAGQSGGKRGICLDMDVRNFELDPAFWIAAEQKTKPFLGTYRLDGRVDVKGHYAENLPGNQCSETSLVLKCLGNRVSLGDQELGLADGTVHFTQDQVGFEDFYFNVLKLEALPLEILSPGVRAVFAFSKPHGNVCVTLREGYIKTDQGRPVETNLAGEVVCNGVAGGSAQQVEDLRGSVSGHFISRLNQGQWTVERFTGQYDLGRLMIYKLQFTDLQGPFHYDPAGSEFKSSSFTGTLHEGLTAGSWSVSLQEQLPSYAISAAVKGLNLQQMLSSRGMPGRYTGLAEARLELEGIVDPETLPEGRFSLKITDMQMGRQTILGKVLTAIQLKEPKEYIFNGVDLETTVSGKTLFCERLTIDGSPLIFYGSGQVDLGKEQVNLELIGVNRLFGNEDTVINMLARGLGSAIWRIQVKGPIKEPAIETVYLSVLKQPLEIFKRKEPL